MEQNDYKLVLLRGSPIRIDFITLHTPTLGSIEELGYEEFQQVLSAFFFDVEELDLSDIPELEGVSKFLIFSLIIEKEPTLRAFLLKGLQFFTKEEVVYDSGIFFINDQPMTEELWEKMKHILSWQNGIKYKTADLIYNPGNAKAREMQKKIEATRKRVQEIKAKQEDRPEFPDLISGLCSKHPSLNLLNVWDLTYYQFLDQLDRLQIIEEYEFGLHSILAGADSKKLKIKHWTSKN